MIGQISPDTIVIGQKSPDTIVIGQKSPDTIKSDFSMATILMDLGKRTKEKTIISDSKTIITKETLTKVKIADDEDAKRIRVQLDDCELWKSFHRLTNEMIVTKNGR